MKSIRLILALTTLIVMGLAHAEPTGGIITKPTATAIQPAGS